MLAALLFLSSLVLAEEPVDSDRATGTVMIADIGGGVQAQRFGDRSASGFAVSLAPTVGLTLTERLAVGVRPSLDYTPLNQVRDPSGANVLPDRYKNQTTMLSAGLGVPFLFIPAGAQPNLLMIGIEPKIAYQGAFCCRTIDVSENIMGMKARAGLRASVSVHRRKSGLTGRSGFSLGAEYFPAADGRSLAFTGHYSFSSFTAPALK